MLADVLSDTPLRLVHIFLLVAWLGIDVGVFYTSIVLRRAGLSGETRLVLTRLLTFLDLAPRMSLLFMVPVGLGLAYASGLGLDELGAGAMNALFWGTLAVAVVWAWALVKEHHLTGAGTTGTPFQRRYRLVDKSLRFALIVFFLVTGIQSLVGNGIWEGGHVAWKAIVFAIVIGAGEWIDYAFRGFPAAFGELLEKGETPERLARFDRSIAVAYPPVLLVYSGVIVMAILGVTRFGS
ncbi:MAG: hypothetical protein ACR2OD_02530 [Gaiellaceae bacterium]